MGPAQLSSAQDDGVLSNTHAIRPACTVHAVLHIQGVSAGFNRTIQSGRSREAESLF